MANMELNLENLREITSTRLQEFPQLATQPVHIDYLVNRGVMMLTLVLPDKYRGSLYVTWQEDYTLDQKYYEFPSEGGAADYDLLELRHIFINGVRAREERNPEIVQALESNQYMAPVEQYPVYVEFGNRVAIYPKAASTISNGFQWDYIKVPALLEDDADVPGLPGMVHYLIPIAAIEALSEQVGQPTGELDRALMRLLRPRAGLNETSETTEESPRGQRKLPFRYRRAE